MLYMSDECPGCHERVKKFVRRQRDPKPKWHEFTVYNAHCPHCDARV